MEELNKEVAEEAIEQNNEQPIEEVVEEIDESKFESAGNPDVIKVDLDKKPQEQQKEEVAKVNIVEESKVEEKEEIQEDIPVIEEVTMEDLKDKPVEEIKEEIVETINEVEVTGQPLPENVQKLMEFMEETGGDINDYVNLNRDVKKMDDSDVLEEYYRTTKSHLTAEERGFY